MSQRGRVTKGHFDGGEEERERGKESHAIFRLSASLSDTSGTSLIRQLLVRDSSLNLAVSSLQGRRLCSRDP